MELIVVVKLVLVLAVALIVLAIGARARVADPLLLLRKPSLGVRAMLSMFVVFPLFVLLVTVALLYLLANVLLTIPYVRWRRKIAAGG